MSPVPGLCGAAGEEGAAGCRCCCSDVRRILHLAQDGRGRLPLRERAGTPNLAGSRRARRDARYRRSGYCFEHPRPAGDAPRVRCWIAAREGGSVRCRTRTHRRGANGAVGLWRSEVAAVTRRRLGEIGVVRLFRLLAGCGPLSELEVEAATRRHGSAEPAGCSEWRDDAGRALLRPLQAVPHRVVSSWSCRPVQRSSRCSAPTECRPWRRACSRSARSWR